MSIHRKAFRVVEGERPASDAARVDVLIALIRECRRLRSCAELDRVRAVLDVEEELGAYLQALGGDVPGLVPSLSRGRGRPKLPPREAEVAA